MNNVERIRKFAIKAHNDVNHKYNGYLYSFHLEMVVRNVEEFLHLIPAEDRETVLCAAWLHDTIEDCRLTYNDIRRESNPLVADLVYALTNEKGRNRKERANDKYYEGLRNTPYGVFVKLCDRLANAEYSKHTNSRMFSVYQQEHNSFIAQLLPAAFAAKGYEHEAYIKLQGLLCY
jgi:(p)ppGpp synthase/HD superfamily hydrolase